MGIKQEPKIISEKIVFKGIAIIFALFFLINLLLSTNEKITDLESRIQILENVSKTKVTNEVAYNRTINCLQEVVNTNHPVVKYYYRDEYLDVSNKGFVNNIKSYSVPKPWAISDSGKKSVEHWENNTNMKAFIYSEILESEKQRYYKNPVYEVINFTAAEKKSCKQEVTQ